MGEKRYGEVRKKKSLVRPRFRWEDTNKMTLKMGWLGPIWLRIETRGGIFCIMR
jgi:hypothetical protein